ncbi:alpha/beta fold hydrolase [Elioraea rosea]|uniref:alpha/beta fold hydrolase n=1 Tax=Elioraea rosea TaxID=2492390 RepID=UPI001EF425DE|nr:alpha/beta fold hydrolase [Elioraea rosea]
MALLALIGLVVVLAALAAWAWTPDRGRAELEARYLAAPGDMLEVGGTRLHVREGGRADAPAVILLHGFGASLHTWEPWAEALAATHRVIRYDLPGFGLSPPDPNGDYSLARDVALLGALMDRLGVAEAALVGHSMGGRVAWHFAARHPARVTALVLVAPDGFASPGKSYGEAPKVGPLLGLMRHFLPRALLRPNLAAAYADPSRLDEATVTRYHDLMRAPGARDAMLARLSQAVLEDPAGLLPRITAPVLLLWGEQDRMIPATHAADYVRFLPEAQVVRLPGLGHVPHEEDPARSLPPVATFLGG